jgi:DNA repair exonuclease SbcCD ATPase subunit
MQTIQEFAIDPNDPLTFEKVWKMFQETKEQFRETREHFRETREEFREMSREAQEEDRKLREMLREISREAQEEDRKLREQIAATNKQMKETDKKVGELTNRFGRMVEHMVVPNLLAKFKALGYTFEVATRNYKVADEKNGIFVEVDAFLENGDKVMIVEIKSTPSVDDIADHVQRIEKLRKRADLRGDTRKYLGAVAGVVVSDSVKNKALGNGFFVLVPSGDTFAIIKPEGKYRVREW